MGQGSGLENIMGQLGQAGMSYQTQQLLQMQQYQNSCSSAIYPGQVIKPDFKNANQKPKRSIMKLFKDYLEAHRDAIFTLLLILLADHYVFKGAFSETIKAAFSKLLAQAHKKIDEKIEAKL